jgi:hypothetical protein
LEIRDGAQNIYGVSLVVHIFSLKTKKTGKCFRSVKIGRFQS